MKRYLKLLLLCGAVAFLSGCAGTDVEKKKDSVPAEQQMTLSRIENHLGGDDPCEGFNRSMFAVTSFLMDYIARPVGIAYTTIVPRPVITHIKNVCDNLAFPTRAISCLIRAHWMGAGHETIRFLVNTTVGIGGIFDPAEHWMSIHSTDSDFGQSFAAWGIGPGATFVLPMSPTLNIRDTAGMLFDFAFDLKTYIPYAGTVTSLNNMTLAHNSFRQVVSDSNDRYKNYREMATLYRELQLRMWKYNALNYRDKMIEAKKLPLPLAPSPETAKPQWLTGKWLELEDYGPGTSVLDSLRILLFRAQNNESFWYMPQSLFNSSFACRRQERSLALAPERPEFTYAFWPMPEPEKDKDGKPIPRKEKLAVLLPGIGGTATSATPTACGELLNRNGYAVLVIDSTFTWQFVVSNSGCRLPGYLPTDAKAVRQIIRLAIDDLKKDKLVSNPETVLAGYSFGGMHTLKIAELEQTDPILDISGFLAINPPVSLEYAAKQADKMAETMNKYTPAEVVEKVIGSAGSLMAGMTTALPPFTSKMSDLQKGAYRLEVHPETAAFLAGLYFRSSMRSMMFSAHRERGLIPLAGMPVEFTRNKLYQELDKITFKEYAEKYLKSEYPGVPLATLYSKSDLRSLEETLKNNSKIKILHAENDFLLSEDDKKFLDSTLGKRITWTSRGGHLGQLYYQTVQQEIIELLR